MCATASPKQFLLNVIQIKLLLCSIVFLSRLLFNFCTIRIATYRTGCVYSASMFMRSHFIGIAFSARLCVFLHFWNIIIWNTFIFYCFVDVAKHFCLVYGLIYSHFAFQCSRTLAALSSFIEIRAHNSFSSFVFLFVDVCCVASMFSMSSKWFGFCRVRFLCWKFFPVDLVGF